MLEEIPAADERNAEHDERGRQTSNEEIGHKRIALNPCVERCERKKNRQAAVLSDEDFYDGLFGACRRVSPRHEYIDDDTDNREYRQKRQNAVKTRCEHCGHEALLSLKPRHARSVHVRLHDIA